MKLIVYMIILSLNTPIGILIGIIVTLHKESEDSGSHVLAIGVLQGLAAGTLLYITFFEVLARDKLTKYGMSGLAGALAVILGFAFMGGMEAAPGLSHSHSHDMGHGHGHDMGHHDVHDMDHHHEALSEAEGHLHMAHEQYGHGEHDHDDDHNHEDNHEHEGEHSHDDHDHEEHSHEEHEDHDHHDDDDIDTDLLQVKSDDYFELNGTDYKFMHDM